MPLHTEASELNKSAVKHPKKTNSLDVTNVEDIRVIIREMKGLAIDLLLSKAGINQEKENPNSDTSVTRDGLLQFMLIPSWE
jgi:hypothetical protein